MLYRKLKFVIKIATYVSTMLMAFNFASMRALRKLQIDSKCSTKYRLFNKRSLQQSLIYVFSLSASSGMPICRRIVVNWNIKEKRRLNKGTIYTYMSSGKYAYFIYNVALDTLINPISLIHRILQLILQTVIHKSQESIIALRFAGILRTFAVVMFVVLRGITFGLNTEIQSKKL